MAFGAMESARSERPEPAASPTNEVTDLFAYYRQQIQPAARICPTDRIGARLKTFTAAEVRAAIEHFAADSWWMRHNGNRGAPWFFKSDERIEQFLCLVPRGEEEEDGKTRKTAGKRVSDYAGIVGTYLENT